MKTRHHRSPLLLLALVALALAAACYHLVTTRTLLSASPVWTGTGTRSVGGIHYSLGLAGEDVYEFSATNPTYVDRAPFLAQFGGPYELKSYVQNRNPTYGETEFIYGNLAGRTDNLRLLYRDNPWNAATWVDPASVYFNDHNETYQVVQVCELAASETQDYVSADSPDSHVFMSVRAKSTFSGRIVGGVVELQTDRVPPVSAPAHWWVRTVATGTQAALHWQDGSVFDDECLHISVTSDPTLSTQYLAVASSRVNEILTFDAFDLARGALDSLGFPHAYEVLQDVTIEGRGEGGVDYAFLATLWHGAQNDPLRHFQATNGQLGDADFLTETLLPDVKFIEGDNPPSLGDTGELYTFGNAVQMRTYQKN